MPLKHENTKEHQKELGETLCLGVLVAKKVNEFSLTRFGIFNCLVINMEKDKKNISEKSASQHTDNQWQFLGLTRFEGYSIHNCLIIKVERAALTRFWKLVNAGSYRHSFFPVLSGSVRKYRIEKLSLCIIFNLSTAYIK